MKIPSKFQVFDQPVTLTSKDQERLNPYLVGWMHLTAIMADINEADLRSLVILELVGKQRWKFLDRLLGRIQRIERKRVVGKIVKCLPRKRSPKPRSKRK